MTPDAGQGPADVPADVRPDVQVAPRRLRAVLGAGLLLVVLALAAAAIRRNQDEFFDALRQMGWGAGSASLLLAAAGVATGHGVWSQSLRSIGAHLPVRFSVPVFFVSQLGKYLPGSVWPVLAQMSAGRAAGIPRRTMLTGNAVSMVLTLAVGTTFACVLLPLSNRDALGRYWWLFLVLPLLLAAVHPRFLPSILDRVFRLLHKPEPTGRLSVSHLARAGAWSALGWLLFGAHLAVLCAGFGKDGLGVLALCIAAMALAVTVGLLLVPFPAGAGVREVALVIVLSSELTTEQALAVAVASRVLLIVGDLGLAALGAGLGVVERRRLAGSVTSAGRGLGS